jgi:alpha-ribazole phosphatase
MTVIDFVRHGATVLPGVLLGRTDAPLSAAGRAQVQGLGNTLADTLAAPARIVTSPLARARQTATILAGSRATEVSVDAAWAELDFGAWDGQPLDVLRRDHGAALVAFYADPMSHPAPGGEDPRAFAHRIEDGLRALAATDAGAPVLIATHAGPIRAALSLACAVPFAMLWAVRIDYATRVRLKVGLGRDGKLWGEILELTQPKAFAPAQATPAAP